MSTRIFNEHAGHDLGELTVLPKDVLVNIFQFFTLEEAIKVVTVSKFFFKTITSKRVWAKEFTERNFSSKGK